MDWDVEIARHAQEAYGSLVGFHSTAVESEEEEAFTQALKEVTQNNADATVVSRCISLASAYKMEGFHEIVEELRDSGRFSQNPEEEDLIRRAAATFFSIERLRKRPKTHPARCSAQAQ